MKINFFSVRNCILNPILYLGLLLILLSSSVYAFEVLRYDNWALASSSAQNQNYTAWLRQLNHLKNRNYRFYSLSQLQQAQRDSQGILLLVIDHPDAHFYQQGFPLLQLLHIPAILCISGHQLKSKGHLRWDQIQTMLNSGLIELASAGYHLDAEQIANPQGDMEPAATTRRWLAAAHRYEAEKTYQQRVHNDLERNNLLLEQHLGRRFHIVAWPNGLYNSTLLQTATNIGLSISLDMSAQNNTWPLSSILHQLNITPNTDKWELEHKIQPQGTQEPTVKVMHVNMDYIYDANPEQERSNLQKLLDRIHRMNVNTVYLQAFADPDGNGAADAVYFPTSILPVRQDLYNHVAWQIHIHTQAHIYAWMPLLAWQLPTTNPLAQVQVITIPSRPNHTDMGYPRLTPFSQRAQKLIAAIYDDLAQHSYMDGLLFHDDATLSDFEDDSNPARLFYQQMHLPANVALIRQNPPDMERWTLLKTMTLDKLALAMAQRVRNEHPELKTARNIYAQVVLHPESETWYAQSLKRTLHDFDYAAIEAMPYMENATDHPYFYHDLLKQVAATPHGLEKTVFELQTKDWRTGGTPIATPILAQTICMLYGWGVQNIGYIPDDPFRNNPDPRILRPALEHHCQPAASHP